MQPLYNVNYVITCNNTTSTCVSHASFTVLVKNIFPPLKALFHQITLFQSILQTCAFWVPILLARVPIWSPFQLGPHANWEQCTFHKLLVNWYLQGDAWFSLGWYRIHCGYQCQTSWASRNPIFEYQPSWNLINAYQELNFFIFKYLVSDLISAFYLPLNRI